MTKPYEGKTYIHFDYKVGFNKEVENYVKGFKNNPNHNFLPLIYSVISFEKYIDMTSENKDDYVYRINNTGEENRVPIKEKKRQIMYASHRDNFIYKHYGLELNELYNNYLEKNKFSDASVAYRTNKNGQCNIHFSAEVMNFIKENENCYVYIGDFSSFFDTLDHQYLKKMILNLYSDKRMPEHQYKIYRSLTKYSYIDRRDINFYTSKKNGKYKNGNYRLFHSMKNFRQFKIEPTIVNSYSDKKDGTVLKKNSDPFGIPQGTAISAIYSNIYMMDIDKYIHQEITKYSGIYRRYSDDYIIVLPNITEEKFNDLKKDIESRMRKTAKLTIHPQKTQVMKYQKNQLVDLKTQKVDSLDYLGFIFDGKKVKLREKSIYKYYRGAYELIKKGVVISKKKGHVQKSARLAYKRKLYQKYHLFGERTDMKYNYKKRRYGTFITYVFKSQRIFDDLSPGTTNMMSSQIKSHQKKIAKRIFEAEHYLKNFRK